jgi:hypothetical protein
MAAPKEAKKRFLNLFKEGYFFRVQQYSNGKVYQLAKQFDSSNNEAEAIFIIELETNERTAKYLRHLFGFSIHRPINYFGKGEIVQGFLNCRR